MDRPKCANCPFWLHLDWGDGDEGECHHGPPALVTGESGGLHAIHSSAWPPTVAGEFCGGHPGFLAWLATRGRGG